VSTAIHEPKKLGLSHTLPDAPVLKFWGVLGSLPAPGPDTAGFGGNTTCLEIALPGDARSVIIDAGSGLAALGRSRDWSGTRRVDLLLTHLQAPSS
jgi:hypothetical protein